MAAECRDEFDEIIVKGDNVRLMKGALAGIVAGSGASTGDTAELLMPLFNGSARVTVAASQLVRA